MEMTDRSSASDGTSTPPLEKEATEHVERIKTKEQVPGHSNYYEKDGLRTYGDDEGLFFGQLHINNI